MSDPFADPRIVPAATAVVFRKGQGDAPELLLTTRARELSFAGAATVFPGGKVDPEDFAMADDDADTAARIAAIRETLEETGLVIGIAERVSAEEALEARARLDTGTPFAKLLEGHGWTLRPGDLVPFARWVPLSRKGRIFDTRFYLADLGTGAVDLTPYLAESTHLFWLTARAALDKVEAGELKLIFPTRRNMERLAQFDSFQAARAHALATPIEPISPHTEVVNGEKMLCFPEGLGYPVTRAPLAGAD